MWLTMGIPIWWVGSLWESYIVGLTMGIVCCVPELTTVSRLGSGSILAGFWLDSDDSFGRELDSGSILTTVSGESSILAQLWLDSDDSFGRELESGSILARF